MPESTITCPKCGQNFEPTAAMAAEVEARIRREFEARSAAREKEALAREKAAEAKVAAAEKTRLDAEARSAALDAEVARKLAAERARLAEDLRKQARAEAEEAAAAELRSSREDAAALRAKLAASQQAELDLRKQKQKLDDDRASFELDKQRAIDEARKESTEKAQREEIPMAIDIVTRAQFFLLVLDEDVPEAKEMADGGKITQEVLQQVAHPARVHVVNLKTNAEVVRVERTGDADFVFAGERAVIDPEVRAAMKRQVNNCALAREVWAAIKPPKAEPTDGGVTSAADAGAKAATDAGTKTDAGP